MKLFPSFGKLGTKLSLMVTIAILFVSISSGLFIINHEEKVFEEELIKRGKELVTGLAYSTAPYLMHDERWEIYKKIRDLAKSSDIVSYSMVTDLKGEILVHSNPKVYPLGMRLDDEITIKTLGIRDVFIQPRGNSYDLAFPVFYNNIPKGIVRIGISKKIMQEKINKSIFDLVLFSLLFSLIGILGAIIFSRTISKPLHQLSETAEAISKGELEHELYSDRKDEIGRLINNFHAMAINVKKAKEDLEKLSTMDEITGVYNHRFFYRMLQSEFEKSKRYNYVIACIMFDVDHFKSINDTYGHQLGDFVLRKLGSLTTSVLRSTDIISRYGGDEFLILLPHSDKDSALIFAEKIRKKIEGFTFSNDGHSIKTTISIGVSTFPDVDTSAPEDLIKNADLSLYKSKSEGRNKVNVWNNS